MSLRSKHWVESKHKRDGRGRFADKAGGGKTWIDKVSHAMEERLGGGGKRSGNRVEVSRQPNVAKGEAARIEQDVRKGVERRKARQATRGPMTDAEFEARAAKVTKAIDEVFKTLATDVTQKNPDGSYKAERAKIHRQIISELYAKAAHVPNDRRAVIAGGLGGAGKTTVLKGHAGINPDDYLNLNPDDIKELLAEKGLIPEVPGHPDLSPMERAALVHEESSTLALMLAERALADGKNMMWDITMASKKSVQGRVAALKERKYKEIKGVFVDIPVEVSVSRAMGRYRNGADRHLAGKGVGGRFVPPHIIRANRTGDGQTINRKVFDEIRDDFTDWSMYDNSVDGRAPQLMKRKSKVSRSARDFMAAASTPATPAEGRYNEWPLPAGQRKG